MNCPQCNRPNAENRSTCLYCGVKLPQMEGKKSSNVQAPKRIRRAGVANYLMVLIPEKERKEVRASLDPQSLTLLGEYFRADAYQWSQWLKIRSPRVLRTFTAKAEAEKGAAFLARLELRCMVVASESLHELGYSFRASRAEFSEAGLVFHGAEGACLTVKPEQAFLLVKGKITVQRNPTKKTNFWGKNEKEDSRIEEDTHDYEVFDLFHADTTIPPLRVKSSAFDFSCMKEKATSSSVINFSQLIQTLHACCKSLRMDESFRLLSPVFTDDKTAGLFDPTAEHVTYTPFYQHNERQFDQYARLICYLYQQGVSLLSSDV